MSSPPPETALDEIRRQFEEIQSKTPGLYEFLNTYRAWFNAHVKNYELILEDNWFEGKTTIEYIFRSLDTLNLCSVAEDEYLNHIASGTWHLGEYVKTYWTVDNPWLVIEQFFNDNPKPVFKDQDASR